jgi:hypothetical protein
MNFNHLLNVSKSAAAYRASAYRWETSLRD